MTVEDVKARVAEIEANKDDDEKAHGLEGKLYRDVLEAIVTESTETPKLCAYEALQSQRIQFARWCA